MDRLADTFSPLLLGEGRLQFTHPPVADIPVSAEPQASIQIQASDNPTEAASALSQGSLRARKTVVSWMRSNSSRSSTCSVGSTGSDDKGGMTLVSGLKALVKKGHLEAFKDYIWVIESVDELLALAEDLKPSDYAVASVREILSLRLGELLVHDFHSSKKPQYSSEESFRGSLSRRVKGREAYWVNIIDERLALLGTIPPLIQMEVVRKRLFDCLSIDPFYLQRINECTKVVDLERVVAEQYRHISELQFLSLYECNYLEAKVVKLVAESVFHKMCGLGLSGDPFFEGFDHAVENPLPFVRGVLANGKVFEAFLAETNDGAQGVGTLFSRQLRNTPFLCNALYKSRPLNKQVKLSGPMEKTVFNALNLMARSFSSAVLWCMEELDNNEVKAYKTIKVNRKAALFIRKMTTLQAKVYERYCTHSQRGAISISEMFSVLPPRDGVERAEYQQSIAELRAQIPAFEGAYASIAEQVMLMQKNNYERQLKLLKKVLQQLEEAVAKPDLNRPINRKGASYGIDAIPLRKLSTESTATHRQAIPVECSDEGEGEGEEAAVLRETLV